MKKVIDEIYKFNDDRGWRKYHTPSNLAKSISIEAAELLECFQWDDTFNQQNVEEELADVLIYCIDMARMIDVNIEDIIIKKIKKNGIKYPIQSESEELI